MDNPEYCRLLGALVADRLSLEFALRCFLAHQNRDHEAEVDLFQCAPGARVPVNSLTNWDTLGELVDKFNKAMEERNLSLRVDRGIVDIRDMIGHGRVAGKQPRPPFTLWKLERPCGGQVLVQACEVLDGEWLRNAGETMGKQIGVIVKACKELGYSDLMSEVVLG